MEYIPKFSVVSKEIYDSMDNEAKEVLGRLIVTKEEVTDQEVTLSHKDYGDIVVTPGNYILTPRQGEQTSITPDDFELRYVPFDVAA